MSINVKKLNLRYYQRDLSKVLWIGRRFGGQGYKNSFFLIEDKRLITKLEKDGKLEGLLSEDFSCYIINNEDVINNQVFFFNKEPEFRNSSRVYLILFNDVVYEVSLSSQENQYSLDELSLLIKEKIYKENKKFLQIKKEIELYEKFDIEQKPERREPIPEEVKFEVWRRDGGKCVICGSQKNLEFDHIIPFSKGGATTTRNLQLLCQECNRHKSDKI